MSETVRADPVLRRWAALAVLALLLAGGALLYRLATELDAIVLLAPESQELAHRRFLGLVRIVLFGVAAVAVALGLFWLQRAWRGLASGRLPPPGSRVLRDQPLLTGPRARRSSILLAVLGLLIMALGIALPPLVLGRLDDLFGRMRDHSIEWQLTPPAND